MYSAYYNRTTGILAFFEGMVRSYDWGALLELIKRRQRAKAGEEEPRRDKKWSERIVSWYINDSVSAFESEEAGKLARDGMLYRRSCAVANVMLGPMPTKDVILRYEEVVPGACDKIMKRAEKRLEQDGDTELELLKQRGRQGYMGMAAGFALAMLLTGVALLLILTGYSWPGFGVMGINGVLGAAASIYITKAQVRDKLYNRDFFPGKKRSIDEMR